MDTGRTLQEAVGQCVNGAVIFLQSHLFTPADKAFIWDSQPASVR